ncbi:MAG: hypothetical protein HC797_02625 [Anaerolineales bacterium]|nr:hypothetical protein [Anaerolineales bacterium]
MMDTKRKRILIGLGVTCLFIAIVAGVSLNQTYQFHGFIVPPVQHDNHVFLRTENEPLNLSNYHNKIVLLYFGYTYCPDVCPTSLAKLKIALSELSERIEAKCK